MGLKSGDLDLRVHISLETKKFVLFLVNAKTFEPLRILASNLSCVLII